MRELVYTSNFSCRGNWFTLAISPVEGTGLLAISSVEGTGLLAISSVEGTGFD